MKHYSKGVTKRILECMQHSRLLPIYNAHLFGVAIVVLFQYQKKLVNKRIWIQPF